MEYPYAIFHHHDAVLTQSTLPVGRQVAGSGLIEGIIRYGRAEALHVVADDPVHLRHFDTMATAAGWSVPIEYHLYGHLSAGAGFRTMLLPGPSLGPFAWARRKCGQQSYALCGLTHSISTKRMTAELYDLLVAPLHPADAIICTSNAVRSAVRYQFDHAAEVGWAPAEAQPRLPVIPLGIDVQRFVAQPEIRALWRTRLKVPANGVVALSVGRLCIFEKLHPAPLFLALQQAAQNCESPLHLVMCGWFADRLSERLHRSMALELAPDVDVTFLDGSDPETVLGAYQAADLFTFPIDNIQETFGLAPIEAMAAGLPVVASDWNGLAESVVNGETGFRVHVAMARPGSGVQIAADYAGGAVSYMEYLRSVHQRVAVDVRALAEGIGALAADPMLRSRMGQAARERARAVYDWSVVVPQLEDLWAEQAAQLEAADRRLPAKPTGDRPPHPDPFSQYQAYPSRPISSHDTLELAKDLDESQLAAFGRVTGATPDDLPGKPGLLSTILRAIRVTDALTVSALSRLIGVPVDEAEAAILWLAKFDLLAIVPGESSA